MQFLEVYQCLRDGTRVRILNLLLEGPLCVGHLAEILRMDQAKVSRHLKALKAAAAVEPQRCHNWTIYRLAEGRSDVLEANLQAIRRQRGEERILERDLERRQRTIDTILATDWDDLPEEVRCVARGTC